MSDTPAAGPAAEEHVFSMDLAARYFIEGDFENSLKHFFVCMVMLPEDRREQFEDQFAAAIHGFVAMEEKNAHRALNLYPQIKKLFPNSIRAKIGLVRAIQGSGDINLLLDCLPIVKEAMSLTDKPSDLVPLRLAYINLSTLPFPQYHIRMINDRERNEAFAKAIRQSIKSRSSVVFDIGSGTGLLSVLAARQTNQVIALEENLCLLKISKEVLKRNGVENRVTVVAENSRDYKTDLKADVIVSEILDCCVFGEGIVETFIDAHNRFAHKDTIFIPNKASVFVRIFSCREIFEMHCQDYGGVRYRSDSVRTSEADPVEPYWCCSQLDFASFEFLSHPEEIYNINFTDIEELKKAVSASGSLKIMAAKAGVAHGFALHFTTDLTGDGVTIDSSATRAWDLGIIPFKEPCVVQNDEELNVSWKLNGGRLDVINEFYPAGLQNSEDPELMNVRYERATLEQLQKIRDDSYFKQQMAEVEREEIPFTEDLSNQIPVQLYLDSMTPKKPISVIIASFCRHDGSLAQESFFGLEEHLAYADFVKKIVPTKVRVIGRMFFSDRIHREARPHAEAHCGVDLNNVRSFNLREMRDIRLHERNDIEFSSHEFEMADLSMTADAYRQDKYTTLNREITVQTIRQIADGVIYEFEILGVRNTRLRPVAAFLFPERVNTEPEMHLTFDYHIGEMFIQLTSLLE